MNFHSVYDIESWREAQAGMEAVCQPSSAEVIDAARGRADSGLRHLDTLGPFGPGDGKVVWSVVGGSECLVILALVDELPYGVVRVAG